MPQKDNSKNKNICKYYWSHRGEPTYEFGCVKDRYIPINDLQNDVCVVCKRKILVFGSKQEEPMYKLEEVKKDSQ